MSIIQMNEDIRQKPRICVSLYKRRYVIVSYPRLIRRMKTVQLKFSVSQLLYSMKTALSTIFKDYLEIFINFTYNTSRTKKINIWRYTDKMNGIAPKRNICTGGRVELWRVPNARPPFFFYIAVTIR